MIIILMGVTGAGKSTVGELLSNALGWDFYDGDAFHSSACIEKMKQGVPLTDDDRKNWLRDLRNLIRNLSRDSRNAVMTCSALKQSYRDYLLSGGSDTRLVFLKGDCRLIRKRLESRKGHFMNIDLLASQFETLEEPQQALTIDISETPDRIVEVIKGELIL